MADEEKLDEGAPTEEQPAAEEEIQGAEFVPELAAKPKPDVYTGLLVLAFVAFLVGVFLATNELYEFYDVQFWVFSKK